MNRLIPFAVFCSLIMMALAGKQPEVVGVMDPVATYSGMTTICEAGEGGAYFGYEQNDYVVYAIPFPRPPGYIGPGSTFGQSVANVRIPKQPMDDSGANNSTEHYVSANITGCEAWVSLIPRDDIGVPYQGSSLTGENIDSGGNFEADISLAIHVDDPTDTYDYLQDFAKGRVQVFRGSGFALDTESMQGTRYFMNTSTIRTDMDPRLAWIGVYSDLNPMPLNCDMLLIMVSKHNGIRVFDPVFRNEIDYNREPNDDCVQVLWGLAVYYDVAVPFSGRGSVNSADKLPVSVRAIIRELLAT